MGPFITVLAWTADELEHKQLLERSHKVGYSDFQENNSEEEGMHKNFSHALLLC